MLSWNHLVWPLLGIGLSAASGLGYAIWRDWRAARSLPAVQSGRRVTIPVTVDAERDARGRALVDGDDLRVVTGRHHLVLGRREVLAAGTRRDRFDGDLLELTELRGYVDADGRHYFVGPPEEWTGALEAALSAPPQRARRAERLWAAVPRSALGLAGAALLAGALFQGIWWGGHDATARMVRVVATDEGDSCAVTWQDGGRQEYAEVDCYEPYPAAGRTVRIRALPWPFAGSAMDYEGTFEGVTTLTAGAVLVALLGGAVIGGCRLRRRPVRLFARQDGSTSPATAAPRPAGEVGAMSFRELVRAVSDREGWALEAVTEPPAAPWWAPAVMVLGSGRWWPAAVLLAIGWLPESMPQPWRVALSAGAVVVLLVAGYRALTAWLVIRRASRGPVTSEWHYQLVRTVDDDWVVVLLLQDTPHWAVVLAGEAHPLPEGRCGVRGDLQEGGAVQILIDGHFWLGGSPVLRCDDAFRSDVRDDLEDRVGAADRLEGGARD